MAATELQVPLRDLLQLLAEGGTETVKLSDEERDSLKSVLKLRAQAELDYGQEIKSGKARLIRRVTGSVSMFFN
jgi:hypothetical protein